jgi:hypothetical protein
LYLSGSTPQSETMSTSASSSSWIKQTFTDLGRAISGNTAPNPISGAPPTKKSGVNALAADAPATVDWVTDLNTRMGQLIVQAVDTRIQNVEVQVDAVQSQSKKMQLQIDKYESLLGKDGCKLRDLESKFDVCRLELTGYRTEAQAQAEIQANALADVKAIAETASAQPAGGRVDPMQSAAGDPWARRSEAHGKEMKEGRTHKGRKEGC